MSQHTEDWLKTHGERFFRVENTCLITIGRKVDFSSGPYSNTYTISFYGQDGNEEEEYLYYVQDIDANRCALEVKGPEDRL
jgi:hypothetical protein